MNVRKLTVLLQMLPYFAKRLPSWRIRSTMRTHTCEEKQIIFNGTAIPPATTGEICNNVIRTIIKDKLKISLQPSDISIAH